MAKKTFKGRRRPHRRYQRHRDSVPAGVQHERLVHGEHVRRENRLCALY